MITIEELNKIHKDLGYPTINQPCPICGNKDIYFDYNHGSFYCFKCKFEFILHTNKQNKLKATKLAIGKWNNRN